SLRAPFIVGDRADMMLTISWRTAVAEPDASTLLLVRRFIDQAGLAPAQVRGPRGGGRAGPAAPRRPPRPAGGGPAPPGAPRARGLQEGFEAVRGAGGLIGLVRGGGDTVELMSTRGYEDDEIAMLGEISLESDLPLCRAIRTDAAVWALDDETRTGLSTIRDPAHFEPDIGWVALPF